MKLSSKVSGVLSRSGLVRVFSGLLVAAGMAASTSASAQYDDGYDNTAQLLTGLAIGAVAGYALIEASDGFHEVHYRGHHRDRHHRHYRHRHRHYHGCGHRHDRHYSYHRERRHYGHHGHNGHHRDRHHRGHHDRHDKKHYRHHDRRHDGRHGERHGVYRIKEESRHRGGHERRVTVTHF